MAPGETKSHFGLLAGLSAHFWTETDNCEVYCSFTIGLRYNLNGDYFADYKSR